MKEQKCVGGANPPSATTVAVSSFARSKHDKLSRSASFRPGFSFQPAESRAAAEKNDPSIREATK